MDILFGTPALDKTYDVCDILESIAPNVSELQLFRDDVGETLMWCKSRSPLFSYFLPFQFCFTSLYMGRSVLLSPVFTFSPFVTILLPFTGSLFARPGPLGLGQRQEWASPSSTEIIIIRSILILNLRSD